MSEHTLDQIVAVYIKIRNKKSEIKKAFENEYDALNAKQVLIENHLLKTLNENGVNSMASDAGTFYKEEVITPSCADWPSFYQWVRENDAFEALERRVTKSFMVDILKAGGNLPPGISVQREHVARVRKGNK